MKLTHLLLLILLIQTAALSVGGQTLQGPETVVVSSGPLQLRALLWRPKGKGPFPAVIFNHGRGLQPQTEGRIEGITKLGHLFATHRYVFMAVFRRGEGLSADQGVFIGDLLEPERIANGDEAAKTLQLRLLKTDQLEDAMAGLAFLRRLKEVDRHRVAVVGHSFGGSLSLLAAERDRQLRAVVNFAGATGSWEGSLELRKTLIGAVRRIVSPVFFIYAANDFSVTAGKVLDAEMSRRFKRHKLKLFPPFGSSPDEAHQFVYLGIASWERDVFAFLDRYMKRRARKPPAG